MSNLCNDIRYDIDKYCITHEDDDIFAHTNNISIDDMRLGIKNLKNCTFDCTNVIFSKQCINGTELLFSLMYILFTMILTNGTTPEGLLLSTVLPMPKKRGHKYKFNHYRQIAINSLP